MECEVLFFGMIAERLGVSSQRISLSGAGPGDDLMNWLRGKYPELTEYSFSCAVNERICSVFPEGEVHTIAVLPPFAGG